MEKQFKIHKQVQQMEYLAPEFDNSYVRIKNKKLYIQYRRKQYKIALNKIIKINLSKNTSRLWFPLIPRFLCPGYKLFIQTSDNEQIAIKVRSWEKKYFIRAISIVRNIKSKIHHTTSLGIINLY